MSTDLSAKLQWSVQLTVLYYHGCMKTEEIVDC